MRVRVPHSPPAFFDLEGCLSGQKIRSWKPWGAQVPRGFESHPFRFQLAEALAKAGKPQRMVVFSCDSLDRRRGYSEINPLWVNEDLTGWFCPSMIKRNDLMFYTYVLLCSDNRTYIGSTNDLGDRIRRHRSGYVSATKKRLPVKMLSYFAFSCGTTARNFEKYLKSGSGRAFIKKHEFMRIAWTS